MDLSLFWRLRNGGVLGMNGRNVDYIARYNPRSSYPLVDDKLATKRLALAHGIAVPHLYGVIERYQQIRHFEQLIQGHDDFAIKPSAGSGGDGIIIIVGRRKGRFVRGSGSLMNPQEIEDHMSRIIGGIYSLGGQPDKVILEARVLFDPVFEQVSYLGVPDLRIIVFQGYPVMAMVRLPTRMSDGKANLHKGAIGAGICIARGKTLSGVWKNSVIEEHPDTGHQVTGIAIPGWNELLLLAARCYEMTSLGYLGVDIVLDRDRGPLLLELNARPGLSIQIANQTGLLPRLHRIESLPAGPHTAAERVEFSREAFGVLGG